MHHFQVGKANRQEKDGRFYLFTKRKPFLVENVSLSESYKLNLIKKEAYQLSFEIKAAEEQWNEKQKDMIEKKGFQFFIHKNLSLSVVWHYFVEFIIHPFSNLHENHFCFFKINFKYLWDASRLDEKNNRNYLILSKREVPPRCSTNTHGPFLKPHAESMQTITKAINKYEMERLLIISHYRFPNIIVNKSIWCSY